MSILKAVQELRQACKSVICTKTVSAHGNGNLALLTRSLLHIMIKLATLIDVPPEHVTEGRTIPSLPPADDETERLEQMITVKTTIENPEHAFTAVKYRDRWFWIDDRDFWSKRTFAFLMILFSLMETGGREGLPLVPIPTN